MKTAAEQLKGLTLHPDWLVVREVTSGDERTDSAFSFGYVVRNAKGVEAFCKALDWSSALEEEDPASALQLLSQAYIFERDLLERCKQSKMRRVVHALGSGTISVPNARPSRVSYLIFELADGDSRDALDSADTADFTVGLGLVRDCAIALGQLHRGQVTHQDVKPANLLGWKTGAGWDAKLADFGRAFCETLVSPHAASECPGDTTWAAPELLYGWPDSVLRTRVDRELGDLYSLGSLLCFALVRVPHGGLMKMFLEPEHGWDRWQGGYASARSLLIDAHEQVVRKVEEIVSMSVANGRTAATIVELVSDMCDPIHDSRGRLAVRGGTRSAFMLERYISRLDRVSKAAQPRGPMQ